MRRDWIAILLVPFILSLTPSEAALESEGPYRVISTEAEYLGPWPSDEVIAERRATRSGGALEMFNIWTSQKRPKIKGNGEITGHSYSICSNRGDVWFATAIFNRGDNISVAVTHSIKGPTPGNVTCDWDNINLPGIWLLNCDINPGGARDGLYKVVSKGRVTRGGSGTSKETARFDFHPC